MNKLIRLLRLILSELYHITTYLNKFKLYSSYSYRDIYYTERGLKIASEILLLKF